MSAHDSLSFYREVPPEHVGRLIDFRERFPERILHVGGTKWRYRRGGAGRPALLVLPGSELVDDSLFDLAPAWSATHRVLCPAYPRAASLGEILEGVRAILAAERIERAALFGAGWGGDVAQCLARSHPDRIRGLVLAKTSIPEARLTPEVRGLRRTIAALPWALTRRVLEKMMVRGFGPRPDERALYLAFAHELFGARLTKTDVLGNLAHQEEYHATRRFSPGDLRAAGTAVLIVESEDDGVPERRRAALRATYPAAHVHTFGGGGHAPFMVHREAYLAAVTSFLGSLAS